MWTRWTQHLNTDKEKTDFQRQIYSTKSVLDRILQILEEKEKTLQTKERDFSIQGWPYHQAYTVAQRDVILELKQLLTLDQKDKI
jgi:hypothetical protein